MSENTREQISALMDDELENGSLFILNAMKDSQEYRDTWLHYHLIGETLRGNLPERIDMGLADRISNLIDKEPAFPASTQTTRQILKPLAGFAIAASVTVVAILGVRQASIDPVGSPSPVVASNPSDNSSLQIATIAAEPEIKNETQEFTIPVDAESRLNRYLVNYNEYRNNVGVQGMLPYVRIVAHEVEE